MADRYFINATGGGGAEWNDTDNWSTSSGGSGGASIPTSSDNVFIDTNSFGGPGSALIIWDGTVDCNDFTNTCSGGGGVSIGNGPSNILNIYGSTNVDTDDGRDFNCSINFKATTTGKTIFLDSVSTLGGPEASISGDVNFDGIGGGWTLSGVMVVGGTLTITNGSFDSGNKTIHCTGFDSSNSNTRSITFGSSTVVVNIIVDTVHTWDISNTTNLTFDAGTSKIFLNLGDPSNAGTFNLYGGGLTYYNFESSNCTDFVRYFIINIYDSNTFNNFTIRRFTNCNFEPSATQTINGTLTVTGQSSCGSFNSFYANPSGTQATISAANVSLSYIRVRDMIATGVASPFSASGTDDGNNTSWSISDLCGITLLARPMYFN